MLLRLLSKRTLACALASIVLVLISVYSWFAIPIEVMPKENTPPYLMVRVNALSVQDPELLEISLAKNVEGALKTVSHVISVNSSVDTRGLSVSINLKPNSDLDIATIQIYEALGPLSESGNIDINQVSITRLNPDAVAVVKLSIALDSTEKLDFKKLKDELKICFESVSGVAKTDITGMEPSVLEAKISRNILSKNLLEPRYLSQLLNVRNIQEYVGPLKINTEILPVFFKLETSDITRVLNKPLRLENPVSLASIAQIKLHRKQDDEILKLNGSPTFLVEIYPKDATNLFILNDGLQEGVRKFRAGPFGKQVRIDTIFNLTDDLKSAVSEVFSSLYQAMLITFIVVLIFYRSFMQTILINLTIPITLLLTVLFLYASGKSLNILTLSGLILGIGMVVDNAALVLGRVEELRQNLSLKIASSQAAVDVSLALILSSITNALIFLPIVFIEGGDSFIDLLRAFQMPIIGSVIASLIVALLILPLVRMLWGQFSLTKNISSSAETNDYEVFIPIFKKLHEFRFILAILSIVMFLFCLDRVANMDTADLESPRDSYITANINFSPEIEADERKNIFLNVEKSLLEKKAQLNFRLLLSDFSPESLNGRLTFYPIDRNDKDEELNQLEKRLKEHTSNIPNKSGMSLSVGYSSMQISAGKAKFDLYLEATSQKFAERVFPDIRKSLTTIMGVTDAQLEKDDRAAKQMVLLPKYEVLKSHNINISLLSTTISSYINSVSIDQLKLNGENTILRIRIPSDEKKWTNEEILNLDLKTYEGAFKIRDLVDVAFENIMQNIQRREQKSSVRIVVTADPSLRNQNDTRSEVTSKLNSYSFPSGIKMAVNDSYLRIIEMQKKSQFVIILSVLLIYLVLASMFESIFIPFAIIFSIPLALVFGAGGLWALGKPLDVMARLGLVILVGVGVNSAIILIELIVNLRSQGIPRKDAILIGCAKRFKTVLMTTSIQVISVLPVAMGKAKLMGIPYASLGVVIISGMIFSTLVTLILLPIIYEFCDNLDMTFKRSKN